MKGPQAPERSAAAERRDPAAPGGSARLRDPARRPRALGQAARAARRRRAALRRRAARPHRSRAAALRRAQRRRRPEPGQRRQADGRARLVPGAGRRHPEDLEARRRVLRETQVVADAFIQSDDHTVPFWKPGDARVVQRRIAEGDRANLWTYLDWMVSSSSNAAAAMVAEAPAPAARTRRALPASRRPRPRRTWPQTPKAELGKLFADAIQTPVHARGARPRAPAPGELLQPRRQAARARHLEHGHAARAAALPGEARAGQAGGRLLQPRDQEAALSDGPQDPLRLLAGARRRGRLLQVGLALQLQAGAGLRLQEVPRQRAELHELDRDRRGRGPAARACTTSRWCSRTCCGATRPSSTRRWAPASTGWWSRCTRSQAAPAPATTPPERSADPAPR